MPDGGMGSLSTIKDVVGIGAGLGSIAGTGFSMLNKPKMPDSSAAADALMAKANEESAAARAERDRIEASEASKKKLRMSGNFGRRSLFTNGEEGYSATLGG
jgi:hypothetical protein